MVSDVSSFYMKTLKLCWYVQVYKRFVEIGRVALINEGPDMGKLCVIIDVVDQRRVSVSLLEFYIKAEERLCDIWVRHWWMVLVLMSSDKPLASVNCR